MEQIFYLLTILYNYLFFKQNIIMHSSFNTSFNILCNNKSI